MTKYDLAGNPMPEPAAGNPADPPVRYDLAGNPLPAAPPPSPPPQIGGQFGFSPGTPIVPRAYEPVSDPAPRESPRVGLYAGIGVTVLVVLALVAFGIVHALKPAPVPAPKAFLPYAALDKSFTCDLPAGWTRASGAGDGGNAAGVLAKNGTARIDVEGDLAGSLMGDQATAANNQAENMASMADQPAPKTTPPVETLHVAQAKAMAKKYDDYDEQPMQTLQSPVGDARISEWTASGGTFVGKLHGYRVTLLSTQRHYAVICQCAEADWATLQPAFQRVIHSLAVGEG